MNVKEIMSANPVTCLPTDTLNVAAQQMWEHDCGSVPVVDEDGRLVGMITDRDICMAAYTQGGPLNSIHVANAMAKQIFACRPHDSLETAEHLMSENQIRRLPVMNGDNRPIGMVSLADIARQAATARKKAGLEHELTQTLAAISQPRPHVLMERPQHALTREQHRPAAV